MHFAAERLESLYPGRGDAAVRRYDALAARFAALYSEAGAPRFFSAPGRTEIGGNHTDHQGGRVLAAAIDRDSLLAAAPRSDMRVRLHSEGYAPIELDLTDLSPQSAETGTTAALVRGCAAALAKAGRAVGGFDAAATSEVMPGSGLSSSAAMEVLLLATLDGLYGDGTLPAPERAQMAQFAENVYFGKPSGLMDQMASSVGGLVAIDFGGAEPIIDPLSFDFAAQGYALAVVHTGGSHDNLTAAYAAIPAEMEQVAAQFGQKRLRDVDPAAFEAELPALRSRVSDRALLRAMHFFTEDARVPQQAAALRRGDLPGFLALINASGESSQALLQNLYQSPPEEPLALALALSQQMLAGCGAWRVHGGGFAGTILAFVPLDRLDAYRARMDAVFGAGACQPLNIRPVGALEIPAIR
ncbi:MAG: galactokinase [Oscillospiraceae bacterium]|nr:galactokinase [Oscillospiraceae bacterium]